MGRRSKPATAKFDGGGGSGEEDSAHLTLPDRKYYTPINRPDVFVYWATKALKDGWATEGLKDSPKEIQEPNQCPIFLPLLKPDESKEYSVGSLEDSIPIPGSSGIHRCAICRCFKGNYIGASVRPGIRDKPDNRKIPRTTWFPGRYFEGSITQTYDLAGCFKGKLFTRKWNSGGLIVFSGTTSSCKSEIAKCFALSLLQEAISEHGWPHLLTYEDPVESWSLSEKIDRWLELSDSPLHAIKRGFAFTPRQASLDVSNLRDALRIAKRQKPYIFFVGEVRDPESWKDIFEFSASGHMVVCTTHAGSLVQTMARLLAGTKSAYARGAIARSILALAHLKKVALEPEEGKEYNAILPAVWKGCPENVQGIVSDGLAAILPAKERIWDRTAFMREFIEYVRSKRNRLRINISEEYEANLIEVAQNVDFTEALLP